jgi:hypothetical protein
MKNTMNSGAVVGLLLLFLIFSFYAKNNIVENTSNQSQSLIDLKYNSVIHKESVIIGGYSYDLFFYEKGDPGLYLSFLIVDKGTIIFDSKKSGIEIAGDMFEDGSWVRALVQNGRETMMFVEHGFASNPRRTLILEKFKESFQVTLFDTRVGDVTFYDSDKDGIMELLGSISLGQIPLTPGQRVVYNWHVNMYVPNKDLTFQLALYGLKNAEVEFKNQPDERTFDFLISCYLLTGQIDQGRARLPVYLEWAKQAKDSKTLIAQYRNIFDSKEFKSALLNYQDWIKRLPDAKIELLVNN